MKRESFTIWMFCIVGILFAGISTLGLLLVDPILSAMWVLIVILGTTLVLSQSFSKLQGDTMLVIFFVATYVETIVSGTVKSSFRRDAAYANTWRKLKTEEFMGLIPDVIFRLWPFFHTVIAPLHMIQMHVDFVTIYTKEAIEKDEKGETIVKSPKTEVKVDSTIYLRLSPWRIVKLLTVLGISSIKGSWFWIDFAKREKIDFTGIDENGVPKPDSYKESNIAGYLKERLQNVVHDAIRSAAGELDWEPITNNSPEFVSKIMEKLAEAPLFQQAGLLKKEGDNVAPGECVTLFAVHVERIGFSEELHNAIGAVRESERRARARRQEGMGDKNFLNELMEQDLSAEQAAAVMMFKGMNHGQISFVLADGSSVLDVLAAKLMSQNQT